MRITAILGLTILSAKASTFASISNFHLPDEAVPIVDSSGKPIPVSEATIQIGTFTDTFAATLHTMIYGDQRVIDEFIPSGPVGTFSADGLFSIAVQVDESGALGEALVNNGAYALVIWAPPGRQTHALVFDMGQAFPEQVDGKANLNLGRTVEVGDIAFGADRNLGNANTSSLPPPFHGFTQGFHIEQWADLPFEPLSLKLSQGEEGTILTFSGHPTLFSRVEYSDDLENWTKGESPEFTFELISDWSLRYTDHSPPAKRYYRIVQSYR